MEDEWGFESNLPNDSLITNNEDIDSGSWGFNAHSDLVETKGTTPSRSNSPKSRGRRERSSSGKLEAFQDRRSHSTSGFEASYLNSGHVSSPHIEGDDWGFGFNDSVVKDLIKTQLGQAVGDYDLVTLRALIDAGNNVQALDYVGNNFLHLLASNPKHVACDLPWEWEPVLTRTKEIVNLLVERGVSPEAISVKHGTPIEATMFEKPTDHEQGFDNFYANTHVLLALLEAGSPVEPSLLRRWIEMHKDNISFPSKFEEILRKIISRVADLHAGDLLDSLFHNHTLESYEKQQILQILLDQNSHEKLFDIDQKHLFSPHLMWRALFSAEDFRMLLAAGAKLEGVNDKGETLMEMALVSFNVSDTQDSDRLAGVIAAIVELRGQSACTKLMKTTPKRLLARLAFHGRLETLKLLLDAGMTAADNEIIELEITDQSSYSYCLLCYDIGIGHLHTNISGTLLDFTFFGAQQLRRIYLHSWFTFIDKRIPAPIDILDRDADKNLEALSSYNLCVPKHRECWKYPALMILLQGRGFVRSKPVNMLNEPSFFDAVKLPDYRITTEQQPFFKSWRFLYNHELLQEDWEDEAINELLKRHFALADHETLSADEKTSEDREVSEDRGDPEDLYPGIPSVAQLARFPRLRTLLPHIAIEGGWCFAKVIHSIPDKWRPPRLMVVLVKFENDRITQIRELGGKVLDPNRR